MVYEFDNLFEKQVCRESALEVHASPVSVIGMEETASARATGNVVGNLSRYK
jgi:hypothetical protein